MLYLAINFYFNVDLTPYKLTKKPIFVNTYISSEGLGGHWSAVGGSSIYDLSNNGVKVYIQQFGGGDAFKMANDKNWQLYYEIVVDE